MVLQPCPNESGRCAMEGCATPDAPSHQWALKTYGDRCGVKICRTCDRKRKKISSPSTSKKRGFEEDEEEDILAGDTLVEIIEIYQIRCASLPVARAHASPSLRPLIFLPRDCCARVRVCDVRNRIAKPPRGMVARSNPVPAEQKKNLEYFVYGRFRFDETDAEGVDRLGMQWVPVEGMGSDPEWGDKEDEFDDCVRALRQVFV